MKVENHVTLEFPSRSANESFARTPLFTTGNEERSGMGFTIMESFMDTVKVRSTPGKGTTVTMARRIARRAGR